MPTSAARRTLRLSQTLDSPSLPSKKQIRCQTKQSWLFFFVIVSNYKGCIPLMTDLQRRSVQPVAAGYASCFSSEVSAVATMRVALPSAVPRSSAAKVAAAFQSQLRLGGARELSPPALTSVSVSSEDYASTDDSWADTFDQPDCK